MSIVVIVTLLLHLELEILVVTFFAVLRLDTLHLFFVSYIMRIS
jgi:hypothetical protein